MNKTFIKNTIRMIQNTKSRFIAIMAIVAIGVAFFVGIYSSSTIMDASVDAYDDAYSLKDLTIYSGIGFDEEDVQTIKEVDGISEVEASKFVDVIATSENRSLVTRVHSYTDTMQINQFKLTEGRMPENEHEALAEAGSTIASGFEIGEKITLTRPDDDLDTYLGVEEVTIVGVIETPVYLNMTKENSTLNNRTIKTYLYVPESTFTIERYLEIDALTEKGKDYDAFSDEYYDYVESIKEKVEEVAKKQQDISFESIKQEALDSYYEGLQEYQENEQKFLDEIEDAQTQIDEAKQQIEDGKQEWYDGQSQLEEAKQQLDTQEKENTQKIQDGLQQIEDGLSSIETARKQLDQSKTLKETQYSLIDTQEELNATLYLLESVDGQLPLSSFSAFINEDTSKQLEEMNIDINTATIQDVKDVLNESNTEIESGLKQIEDGITQLTQNLTEEQKESFEEVSTQIDSIGSTKKDLYKQILFLQTYQQIIGSLPSSVENVPLSMITKMTNSLDDPTKQILSLLFSDSVLERLKECDVDVSILVTIKDLKETLNNTLSSKQEEYANLQSNINTLRAKEKEAFSSLIQAQEEALDTNEQTLYTKQKEAQEGLETLQSTIASARSTIQENESTLASSWLEIEAGETELAQKEQEFLEGKEDGEKQLAEAKEKLEEAKKEIDNLESSTWTVLDRNSHYSSVTFKATIEQMAAIGRIFPVFFLLVAILVCLTTMARTVDEQRGEIGTLRALGYSESQCISKYLIYASIATIVGEIVGLIIGSFTFPLIIYNAWKMMYVLPDLVLKLDWKIVLLTIVVFLLVMVFTTWYACKKDMREVPAQLLRPKAPKIGKGLLIERVHFIWNRIGFTWKVTLRNIFRYKQRFFMTVIGVAGCTALLVTGYGVKDSITTLVDKQFDEITVYDGYATLQDTLSMQETNQFMDSLRQKDDIEDVMLFYGYSSEPLNSENITDTIYVQMFDDAKDVENVYDLRTRKGQNAITLSDDGVTISEKLSENMNLKVGDTFSLEDENGNTMEVKVASICEMYVEHYCFMTKAYYISVTGKSPIAKLVAITAKEDADLTTLENYLVNQTQVQSISFYNEVLKRFDTMVKSLNLIVWVIIISSMTLAFIVLVNLINVNIAERQREIATLKVLGFRKKEVEDYIYKEDNILTFIGALVGIPLGIWLHHTIMGTIEMDYVMFGRSVKPLSVIISVLWTLFFGILVNFFMRKKLHNIEMVESLKSVE